MQRDAIYAALLNAGAAGFTAASAFMLFLMGNPLMGTLVSVLTVLNLTLLRFNLRRAV